MSKPVLIATGLALAAAVGLQAARALDVDAGLTAQAAPTALLDGCGDVPEAVALADSLRLRGIAVDRALADLDRRKAEIAAAEARLKTRLFQLREARAAMAGDTAARRAGADLGIERLISVYDAMKPAEAATVLAALPPDFAAEILMRVQPETGARIIAAVDPGQAAILTTHMGARRLATE
ncbi:MotE family protein [Paracoccus luteus]|uniref:MotE family protein n=1 Tax=Paracoccus luteus TaxID=2508543 RepID=UPI0010702F91|nr:hypothetical protein [Paracoccus luteus]